MSGGWGSGLAGVRSAFIQDTGGPINRLATAGNPGGYNHARREDPEGLCSSYAAAGGSLAAVAATADVFLIKSPGAYRITVAGEAVPQAGHNVHAGPGVVITAELGGVLLFTITLGIPLQWTGAANVPSNAIGASFDWQLPAGAIVTFDTDCSPGGFTDQWGGAMAAEFAIAGD